MRVLSAAPAASLLPHQVDHIIGRQHRGTDELENLCLCCVRCNLKKGPNIASVDPDTGSIVALFHPRRHVWDEHFAVLRDGTIEARTAEARATTRLLEMNDEDRVRLRVLSLRRGLPRQKTRGGVVQLSVGPDSCQRLHVDQRTASSCSRSPAVHARKRTEASAPK